jgi:hypothetical protein
LNTTNYATLNESLAVLRTLYADLSGKGKDVNKSDLYRQVLQRCKKEPRIPAFVMSMIDQNILRIERETNAGRMLELVLAPMKYMLNKKPTLPLTNAITADGMDPHNPHMDHSGAPDSVRPADNTQANAQGNAGGGGKGGKGKTKNKGNGNGNGNQNQNQNRNGGNGNKKELGRVVPWPKDRPYITNMGRLTPECNSHFSGYCYKCGLNNHNASKCRIYPGKGTVLTLCSTCRSGFHTLCKNFRFLNKLIADGQGQGQAALPAPVPAQTNQLTHAHPQPSIHYNYNFTPGPPLPLPAPAPQPSGTGTTPAVQDGVVSDED